MVHQNSLNNLKPFSSENEARIKGKNGGLKSGRTRRQRKLVKEYIEDALNSDVVDKNSIALIANFFPDTPQNEFNLLLYGVVKIVKEFVSENTKPIERIRIFEFLRDSIGEKPAENLKIDDTSAEEFEIDKRLAKMSNDELFKLAYGKNEKED